MNPSQFIEYIEKFFSGIVSAVTEKWNGKRTEEPLYHKTMLTEEYSVKGTWDSSDLDHSVVAADVVSLGSSLPLKKRDSLRTASGELPKIGMKFRKDENKISDINKMRALGTEESTIVAKIFDDVPKCIKGMDVRKEIMFQVALSTGVCLIEDADGVNDGTGIRADYGYKQSHMLDGTTGWDTDTANATPITDLRTVFDAMEAEAVSVSHVWIQRKYLDLIRKTAEGKELSAHYQGLVVTSSSRLPMPGRQQMLDALQDEFGATFHIVNASYRIQKHDGTFQTITPWSDGAIVFTATENVGRLVYGTLAEETNPVAGVEYQKSGSHVLISKYSKTDPLEEFTAAQAICLPVIDGGSDIFVLHADGATITANTPASNNSSSPTE